MKNGTYLVGKYAAKAAIGHERIVQRAATGIINNDRPEKKLHKKLKKAWQAQILGYIKLTTSRFFVGRGICCQIIVNSSTPKSCKVAKGGYEFKSARLFMR